MRLDIRYETRFRYDTPVRESHNELRACPVDDDRQRVLDFRLRVDPTTTVQSFRDYWGTRVEAFGVIPRHDRLDVVAEISVETHASVEAPAPPTPIADLARHEAFHEYTVPSRHTGAGKDLAELGRTVMDGAETAEETGRAFADWVGRSLTYSPGATKVDTTLDEVVERRVGVCQDYAHLTVALCRAVALPARYVSGYLFARRDDARSGANADGSHSPKTGEADAVRVQTHAWVEVAVAPGRWQPLDPTNGRDVGERHVKIGHGRDYFDVTPFHGSFSGSADPTLVSSVDIRRRSGEDDRPNILSAADRGLLRRPVPQTPSRVLAQQQEQQQQQ
jgi:transglutaminase-like putative cysteine protease